MVCPSTISPLSLASTLPLNLPCTVSYLHSSIAQHCCHMALCLSSQRRHRLCVAPRGLKKNLHPAAPMQEAAHLVQRLQEHCKNHSMRYASCSANALQQLNIRACRARGCTSAVSAAQLSSAACWLLWLSCAHSVTALEFAGAGSSQRAVHPALQQSNSATDHVGSGSG